MRAGVCFGYTLFRCCGSRVPGSQEDTARSHPFFGGYEILDTSILGVDSPFQPSFFPKTSRFPWVSGGFPERMIPGKNGESFPGAIASKPVPYQSVQARARRTSWAPQGLTRCRGANQRLGDRPSATPQVRLHVGWRVPIKCPMRCVSHHSC